MKEYTTRHEDRLHGKSFPEGWKVKEEESHSEECSISIDEQVQDGISVSNWDFVIATEDSVMIQVQPGMKKYLTKKFSDYRQKEFLKCILTG